jgi:uncharacterized membrane protein
MLLSNAFVWRFLIKGMHSSDQSALVPTLISTASNFCLSGLLGCFIFAEKTNLVWWTGAIMIIIGVYFVMSDNEQKNVKKE